MAQKESFTDRKRTQFLLSRQTKAWAGQWHKKKAKGLGSWVNPTAQKKSCTSNSNTTTAVFCVVSQAFPFVEKMGVVVTQLSY